MKPIAANAVVSGNESCRLPLTQDAGRSSADKERHYRSSDPGKDKYVPVNRPAPGLLEFRGIDRVLVYRIYTGIKACIVCGVC